MRSGGDTRVNPEVTRAFREINAAGTRPVVETADRPVDARRGREMSADERAAFGKKFGRRDAIRPGLFREPSAESGIKGDTYRVRAMADRLSVENPTPFDGALFAMALRDGMHPKNAKSWKREEVVRLFEVLIERGAPIVSHHNFRDALDRDENLYANQVTREANGNIAYRTVKFDVDGVDDEMFWERIDSSPYQDLIEDNAAFALFKHAEKFGIIS